MKSLFWSKKINLLLQITLFIVGLFQVFTGQFVNGFLTLLAVSIITFPAHFTRNIVKYIPAELELLLLIIAFIQLILGDFFHFYSFVPYYDKFTHILFPLLTGFICFIIAHSLRIANKLHFNNVSIIVIVSLFVLGIGSIWEIIEYLSDIFLHPHFAAIHQLQVSLTENPLVDTMNDTIANLFGAVFGAIFAFFYVKSQSQKTDSRLHKLTTEINQNFKK